jgi:hypothetical protein
MIPFLLCDSLWRRAMMGRLNHDQQQLFYSFRLEEAVPHDHLIRKVAAVLDLSWLHSELAPFTRKWVAPSIDPDAYHRIRLRDSLGASAYVRLLEAFGTRDLDFLNGLVRQLCNVGSIGKTADEDGLNFMLSVVKGIEPRDQVEAMLAAQMAATHNATMTFARRLAHVDNLAQQDRYRNAGEQTVRVEHVTVNEGGRAIVGNVSHGGRGSREKRDATP